MPEIGDDVAEDHDVAKPESVAARTMDHTGSSIAIADEAGDLVRIVVVLPDVDAVPLAVVGNQVGGVPDVVRGPVGEGRPLVSAGMLPASHPDGDAVMDDR